MMTKTDLVSEGLATIEEACAFLAIGRSTLYELMDHGELPFTKIGRSRRIPKRALVELAAKNLKGLATTCTIGS